MGAFISNIKSTEDNTTYIEEFKNEPIGEVNTYNYVGIDGITGIDGHLNLKKKYLEFLDKMKTCTLNEPNAEDNHWIYKKDDNIIKSISDISETLKQGEIYNFKAFDILKKHGALTVDAYMIGFRFMKNKKNFRLNTDGNIDLLLLHLYMIYRSNKIMCNTCLHLAYCIIIYELTEFGLFADELATYKFHETDVENIDAITILQNKYAKTCDIEYKNLILLSVHMHTNKLERFNTRMRKACKTPFTGKAYNYMGESHNHCSGLQRTLKLYNETEKTEYHIIDDTYRLISSYLHSIDYNNPLTDILNALQIYDIGVDAMKTYDIDINAINKYFNLKEFTEFEISLINTLHAGHLKFGMYCILSKK